MTIELIEKNEERIPGKLICESCGGEFSCGASIGECWCFSVELSPNVLVNLRERFEKCLCEICLSDVRSQKLVEEITVKGNEIR